MAEVRVFDVTDLGRFELIPPCADPRFDHRTCDYWEDADRGSKLSRPSWLAAGGSRVPASRRASPTENPFAREATDDDTYNPFSATSVAAALDPLGGDDFFVTPGWNPFAPESRRERPLSQGVPRKLALLDRGKGVFGTYAKVALLGDDAVAYAQFGPLSAYPRAIRLRELYSQLPESPLPAVITCVATTAEARRRGYGRQLVAAICEDLAGRGFAAVEAYPDLTLPEDETSAGRAPFWHACGFVTAVDDDRFPVMRRELE